MEYGYGDMVVMSIETYENALYDAEVYIKLKEAELEMKSQTDRKTHEDVFERLYAKYAENGDEDIVT